MQNLPHNFASTIHPYFEEPYSAERRKQLLGKRLLELRKNYHLTQKEVSDIIGITAQTYSGYEEGKFEPSVETLIRLSYLYNTSMDYLTTKYDNPNVPESEIEKMVKTYDPENVRNIEERLALMDAEIKELRRRIQEHKK